MSFSGEQRPQDDRKNGFLGPVTNLADDGQRAITNQAATRYLARNHERLARKHGGNPFVLLLKVVNSQAYGPDVVELVGDVTRTAQAPPPVVATRNSHRIS